MDRRGKTGFTLVELLVIICVLGIVMAAFPAVMDSMLRNSVRTEFQAVAFHLARDKMEEIMVLKSIPAALGYSKIGDIPTTSISPPFGDYKYSIITHFKSYDGQKFLDSETDQGIKQVTITVTGHGVSATLSTLIGNYGD